MNEKQRRGEDIPLDDVKEGRWQRGRAEEGSSHESMEASICRWRLQSAAGQSAGRAQEQQQRMERRGVTAEDGGAGADLQRQSAEGATGGADRARASIRRLADDRSRGGRPEQRRTGGRPAGAESTDGRTASWMPAARRRIPGSPCSLPPPLSSLFPPLSLPSRAEAMRRLAREYRHAISRARPLCSFSPARARRRHVFFNLFPARATALPSVWRPPDALAREATPYERRAWRRRRPNLKLAWTPRRRLGDA